jgi:molecular chaperone GrpE
MTDHEQEPAAEAEAESVSAEHAQAAVDEAAEVADAAEVAEGQEGEPSALDRELEIFQDLQRLQADFVNYRSRVERDRGVERQAALAEAIRAFLPALDDLARAEEHGDLVEGSPMAAIATKLRSAGEKFGLKSFGAKGDRFDPELHDALVQTPSAEVTEATVADVIESGYTLGDRQLRPAKVAVFVPAESGN